MTQTRHSQHRIIKKVGHNFNALLHYATFLAILLQHNCRSQAKLQDVTKYAVQS